jgi:antitoxin (DNA-binding transcriptional repressor) of toxin-antitoxin stability system
MNEVQMTGEPVIVTKRGKPVVKVIPMGAEKDDIFGFMAGEGRIVGDIESPVVPLKDWKIMKTPMPPNPPSRQKQPLRRARPPAQRKPARRPSASPQVSPPRRTSASPQNSPARGVDASPWSKNARRQTRLP